MEFGNPQTLNAKIKFTSLMVENESLIVQIGFEIQGGKTVISDKKIITDKSFISNILSTLEVRSWEELPRKFARVRVNNDKAVAIGNLIDNQWVNL